MFDERWEQAKAKARVKSKEIVDGLDLPANNTFIWHIKNMNYENEAGGSYGSTKSGLRSSLRGWFEGMDMCDWHKCDISIKICPLDKFEEVYRGKDNE